MWLLDSLQENYEVPIALVFGVLCIWLYKRLLKGPEDDVGRGERETQSGEGPNRNTKPGTEGVAEQPVKKVHFNKERPRKSAKQDFEDQIDCLPKTTDVASLHAAVKSGDVDVVRSMLEDGADPNIPDRDANMCLHIIFQDISTMPLEDANEIVEMLLSKISESQTGVNAINRDGKTPLHLAARHTTPSIVRLLLDNGADRTIQDKDGNTPLHTITEYMQFSQVPAEKEILDLLVKHWPGGGRNHEGPRPGINAVNDEKMTPLHVAVRYEEIDNIRVLLGEGADPNIPDTDGNTPLHTFLMAVDQDQPLSTQDKEMLTLLLQAKADPVKQNKNGESVLDLVTNPDVEEEIMKT